MRVWTINVKEKKIVYWRGGEESTMEYMLQQSRRKDYWGKEEDQQEWAREKKSLWGRMKNKNKVYLKTP